MNDKILSETDWRIRVFDSLSFPTLILKPDKVILTANQIFLERLNVELDEVVGKTCHEVFFGAKVCPEAVCPFQRVLEEKKAQSVLRWGISRTGKRIWEDRVFSPMLDDEGNVVYVMESVRDVTRLKNLEVTLKETEAFLEKIIMGSPIAIVAADKYANILLMNPAAEDLFGYSQKDAAARISVEQLYPTGTAFEIMKQLRNENSGGKGKLHSTKTMILNSKGEEIPVEITASIIYEDDEEIATVGIYTDLREKIAVEKKLKETQAKIIQSEKMASLGKLAAGVAHEINNPLTGILLDGNLILESLDPDDPSREQLEYILEDANRCKNIVRDLLAYSRRTSPLKKNFQINELIKESLALIRDQKLFINIKLVKEFSDEVMLIHVDKNQLSQVIINMVINAVDAMEGRGTLTLRTYLNKDTDDVCLEVSDTGQGISKDDIPRVFDPFFTTKKQGKGTGLGLSTSYGIVKDNSGNISIKETGPGGTTFLLEFPRHEIQEENQYI